MRPPTIIDGRGGLAKREKIIERSYFNSRKVGLNWAGIKGTPHVREAKSPIQRAPNPPTRIERPQLQSRSSPLQSSESSGTARPRSCPQHSCRAARAAQFCQPPLALVGPRCRGNGRNHSQQATGGHRNTRIRIEHLRRPINVRRTRKSRPEKILSKTTFCFPAL